MAYQAVRKRACRRRVMRKDGIRARACAAARNDHQQKNRSERLYVSSHVYHRPNINDDKCCNPTPDLWDDPPTYALPVDGRPRSCRPAQSLRHNGTTCSASACRESKNLRNSTGRDGFSALFRCDTGRSSPAGDMLSIVRGSLLPGNHGSASSRY